MSFENMCIQDAETHILKSKRESASFQSTNHFSRNIEEISDRLKGYVSSHKNMTDIHAERLFQTFAILESFAKYENWYGKPAGKTENIFRSILATNRAISSPLFLILTALNHRVLSDLEIKSSSLELGTGMGIASKVHFESKSFSVVSDPGLSPLLYTRSISSHEHYMTIDARHIPFNEGTFETVLAENMLYHVPERGKALQEMARVTARGGVLCFNDINDIARKERPWYNLLKKSGFSNTSKEMLNFLNSGSRYRAESDCEQNFSSQESLKAELKELGFEDIKIIPYFSKSLLSLAYYLFDSDFLLKTNTLPDFSKDSAYSNEVFDQIYLNFMNTVCAPLIEQDEEIVSESKENAYFFLVARKAGGQNAALNKCSEEIKCPHDGSRLLEKNRCLVCEKHGHEFPIFKGISMVTPYYQEWFKNLNNSDRKEVLRG
ncbi:class I SAM-dependent methyltransferase [Curvivirga aplysinae]|uniref:class I SAM-dependent methyltransferase n=1 Tax=Curvivirga aplysinae TaxID=2529852 RepID=UPI0012BD3619|nr:class I SAM-dependent methyltransferase [Curvivirga aplysinae]MTI10212.1 class I SAM-dependent methyltransferase [Curvivirga aplysinae]